MARPNLGQGSPYEGSPHQILARLALTQARFGEADPHRGLPSPWPGEASQPGYRVWPLAGPQQKQEERNVREKKYIYIYINIIKNCPR